MLKKLDHQQKQQYVVERIKETKMRGKTRPKKQLVFKFKCFKDVVIEDLLLDYVLKCSHLTDSANRSPNHNAHSNSTVICLWNLLLGL